MEIKEFNHKMRANLDYFMNNYVLKLNDPNVTSFKDHFYDNLDTNENFKLWLCYDNEQIIGTTAIRDFRTEYFKKVFSIDTKKFNDGTAKELVSDFVTPEYRGKGYQLEMIKYRERWLKEKGIRYASSTVLEDNEISVDNYVKNGYEILSKGLSTWEHIRIQNKFYLLVKDLAK